MITTRRALASIALASAAACGGAKPAGSPVDTLAAPLRPLTIGEPAPRYAAVQLLPTPPAPGDSIRVGGASDSVTLVNVWATWCTSCREELAFLDSLQRENAPRGLRVIAVSVDEGSPAKVVRFATGQHVSFTVAHDPDDRIQELYQVVGVPESFLIGRDGKVRWSYVGSLPDSARAVVARALDAR